MLKRFIYISLFTFLCGFSPALQTEVQEYSLKAAFIYNFTKYINCDIYSEGNEFTIGILGSSLIAAPLSEIARSKTVNTKKIVIRHFKNPQEIVFTNILFISRTNNYAVSTVLPKIAIGTLTISEEDGMGEEGMAINFVIDGSKLKFEANLKVIAAAGLKASSELLQHAIIINQ